MFLPRMTTSTTTSAARIRRRERQSLKAKQIAWFSCSAFSFFTKIECLICSCGIWNFPASASHPSPCYFVLLLQYNKLRSKFSYCGEITFREMQFASSLFVFPSIFWYKRDYSEQKLLKSTFHVMAELQRSLRRRVRIIKSTFSWLQS